MEDMVVFRDYQEQQSADHNNLQLFARQSMDHLVHDAVTRTVRYSGFNTVKSNQAEITIAAGRFYGQNTAQQIGAVFNIDNPTIVSLVSSLPVSTTKIVLVCASGVENLTDVETRDFLTNVTTGQTEPQAVPMQSSRDAILTIIAGAESGTPSAPATPSGQVAVASVLLNTTGVVSVTMLTAGLVTSTEDLDNRLDIVEDFDAQIAPRVTALASDLAALALKIGSPIDRNLMLMITGDVALLKAKANLPATHAAYGASYLLFVDATVDATDTQSLGYAATVEYGVRFKNQNANLFALSLFNTLDPNVSYNSGNGLVLPAFDEVLKLRTGTTLASSDLAIGQYGYQTFTYKEIDIPYSRIRNGGSYYTCSNGMSGYTVPPDGTTPPYWLPNFTTYQVQSGFASNFDSNHTINQYDYLWVDSWTEPYWALEAVNASVTGALVAQSFLISSDTWITQVGFDVTVIASATDINVTLCRTTNGQPDLSQTLARATLTGASIRTGMNYVRFAPTYTTKGDRLAVVLTSNANHHIGMVPAGSYLNGSFFYSLDGVYFLGDFTKEMYLEVIGAKFRSSQAVVEFSALSLAGGIRAIDLTARMTVPNSCQIIFEVMPDGGSAWIPITPENPLAPWTGAPVLARFRARLIGTPDIAPGIRVTDSKCKIWCPGLQFKFVTLPQTVPSTTSVTLQFIVENWDTVAHTLTPKVYRGGPLAAVNPTATTTVLLDASRKRYQITASYTITASTSFVIFVQGDTNSVSNVFHIAQMLWWTI